MASDDRIPLPGRGEGPVRNPFAKHLEKRPPVPIHKDLATYFARRGERDGCDLATTINRVLRKVMNDEQHRSDQ